MRKWRICIFLFLATTLNYLDRQTLSILAPSLQQELHLTNADLGLLFAGFYYAYTFSQFGIGLFLDRTNLRWIYGAAVIAWSAAAALTSLATGLVSLFAFRLLLGVAESANWPAAMRIVARSLPPHERALGNGIFTSGTSVGALIAPALILWLAHASGWRSAFVAVGALGFVWWIAWHWMTRDPALAGVWRDESAAAPSGFSAYAAVFHSPRFWPVFLVAVTVNPCLYFNLNWLPTYLKQQRGIDSPGQAGILTAIFLGLDLGYLASGAFTLLLTRKGFELSRARRAVFGLATALVGLSGVIPLVDNLQTATMLFAVVNFGVGVWIAMYLTLAQEVSPRNVSTAAGMLGGSGSLAGAFGMWAVGRITDQTGSFALPLYAVGAAALLACAAGFAATRTPIPSAAYHKEETHVHP